MKKLFLNQLKPIRQQIISDIYLAVLKMRSILRPIICLDTQKSYLKHIKKGNGWGKDSSSFELKLIILFVFLSMLLSFPFSFLCRSDKQLEWLIDYYHNLLRKIYVQFDDAAEDETRKEDQEDLTAEQKEAKDKLLRQRTLTQYLKVIHSFAVFVAVC